MTVYAPRAPLQLIENPHIMSEAQRNGRRHSSRLAGKEDAMPIGLGQAYEQMKSSQKTAATSKGGKATAGAKTSSKRKQAYDEEDGGFAFTRTRAKKAKAEPKQPPISEEIPQADAQTLPSRRTRKKSDETAGLAATSTTVPERTKRRSTRNSGGSAEEADPPTLAVKKRRKGAIDDVTQTPSGSREPQRRPQHEQKQSHPTTNVSGSTQIALPFADTPIIRRNQEMRRGAGSGSRRSSLGMRGRRASSLIDTGKSNALPHDEVDTTDFYKHIASEGLSEPRRMKQLLTWCGTRALGERPAVTGKDRDAVLAAREIQSQLLRDFSTKSSLSDWFSREDLPKPGPSPPKPNPKNQVNEAKIKELEAQLAALQSSRKSYTALLNPPSIPTLPPPPAQQPQTKESSTQPPLPQSSNPVSLVNAANLPPSQQPHLQSLLALSNTDTSSSSSKKPTPIARLNTLTTNLEPRIDTFATNVHTISSYVRVAEDLADEALGLCAALLEGRERARQAGQDGVGLVGNGERDGERDAGEGLRDVLRGLSRVVERER